MAYGDSVNTIMTTSLPDGGLATSVQLAYSIAVMLTFPLQNFPALEIINRSVIAWLSPYVKDQQQQHRKKQHVRIQRNIISSCSVLFLAVLAVLTMESLDKVVSLLGSLLGCPIAYILPPMIHTKIVLYNEQNKKSGDYLLRLYCNYTAMGFGLVAMIMASITTIIDWK
jgi:proton-coupled amino acid transporter